MDFEGIIISLGKFSPLICIVVVLFACARILERKGE